MKREVQQNYRKEIDQISPSLFNQFSDLQTQECLAKRPDEIFVYFCQPNMSHISFSIMGIKFALFS